MAHLGFKKKRENSFSSLGKQYTILKAWTPKFFKNKIYLKIHYFFFVKFDFDASIIREKKSDLFLWPFV